MGRNRKAPVEDGKARDIVIPVMGPTGAGKSTFINSLLQEERMGVGHHLTSCTRELQPVEIKSFSGHPHIKGRRLILVDTPGFDDTYDEDDKILKCIAEWLEKAYHDSNVALGGVIYLHDISSDRFSGTARRNLEMFQHMCGDAAFSKVVLGTSKWGRKPEGVSNKHEEELKTLHWKPLIKKGSTVCRFLDSHESARSFIDIILRRMAMDTSLQIQIELAVDHKSIPETKAGKGLRVHQMLELQTQMMAFEANVALAGDVDTEAKLSKAREKLQILMKEVQEARIPLPQRFRAFLGL